MKGLIDLHYYFPIVISVTFLSLLTFVNKKHKFYLFLERNRSRIINVILLLFLAEALLRIFKVL